MLTYLRSRSICGKLPLHEGDQRVVFQCGEVYLLRGESSNPGECKITGYRLHRLYALPCQLGRAVRRVRERWIAGHAIVVAHQRIIRENAVSISSTEAVISCLCVVAYADLS